MAANQKRNIKARHTKPTPGGLSDHPPGGRAPSAPTSEQLLASLRNAIQTTNEIVADQKKRSTNTNSKSNGAVARLEAEPWRGVTVSENQFIPPPGVFSDEGGSVAIGRVPEGLVGDDVILLPPPEGFDAEGVTGAGSFTEEGCDVGGAGRAVGSGLLPGNGVVLSPPAVFDNGSKKNGYCVDDGNKNNVTTEKATERVKPAAADGGKVERLPGVTIATDSVTLPGVPIATDSVALPSVTIAADSVTLPGVTIATDSVTLPGVPIATDSVALPSVTIAADSVTLPGVPIATDSVALPGVTVATDSVVGADTERKSNGVRRGDGEEEGKIIGGLFSVREICALIENDRMFVLQGVMDEESAERLQMKSGSVSSGTGMLQPKQVSPSSSAEKLERKPVSVSSSTEKLELKPVSAPSCTEVLETKLVFVTANMEKLEHKPVSVSTGVELKPVSESSSLDFGEIDDDVRAETKSAADVVSMETVTEHDEICHSNVNGPSSLRVMALDATRRLQCAGTEKDLEEGLGGKPPSFVEANSEGNTSATNGNLLSESKTIDDADLYARSTPGIPTDGISTDLNVTTDAPKAPSCNHTASATATAEPTPDPTPDDAATAASFELNKTTAADLARLSTDPDIPSTDLDKPPQPCPGLLYESKASDYDSNIVSLEAADLRVDRSRAATSEPVPPAINTGESRSDAGPAGAVQASVGASATVERNPRPESIVTTHLWSDTAVARVLNVNAGVSTDLSKAGISSDTAVLEITPRVDSEKIGKPSGLEGRSSTGDGDDFPAVRTASREKRKVEVVRVDVTESMEQTERERHFVSRTVKTTMTQETRSSTAGAPLPPRAGVVANSGARPKAGSMFAAGGDVKIEDGIFDGKGSNEHAGLLGELRRNRPGMIEGLKETKGAEEKGIDGGTSGKESAAFDMRLDQRELKSDRNSSSVRDRRETPHEQGEEGTFGGAPSPLGPGNSILAASVQVPGTSSSPTSETRFSVTKEEVSVTKGNLPVDPAVSSSSSGVTGRQEGVTVPSRATYHGFDVKQSLSLSPTAPSPSNALSSRVSELKEGVLITTGSPPASSLSPASPSRAADLKDNVSATKESLPLSPDPPSPSAAHLTRAIDRKEEVVRIPRPTSLMVRPGKPPRHSSSHPSTPSTHQNITEISHAIAPGVSAPLATPEESFDDVPHTNRSRQSSVGPSRSRQSSLGPSRSRQSSMSSLLGYQMAQSGVSTHFVVVAIDFGTTYSGYAFSFTRDPESIHMMRRWEGGDPGIVNQKTPTTLLLAPDGKFHSFGFAARDFYHDLDPQEAKKWMYFEKFKMTLHHNAELNKETAIKASNGKTYPALSVFSHALTFFKDHALQELSDQSSTTILNEDIRWVITVPAIWKAPAKQFMRQAAYQAGIASADNPNQLLIALEPEAASIYVRKLRLYQLMPDPLMTQLLSKREPTPDPLLNRDTASDDEFTAVDSVKYKTLPSSASYRHSISPSSTTTSVGQEVEIEGTNYMVVDCGGGTVDITVYEMESGFGHLKELHKATGGPYGSLGIDMEFEKLLIGIFGSEFIEAFRTKRPAGWVDLLIAFESRKRTASPFKNNPLNVSLPFSFIDYYKKYKGSQVESAIRKYGNKEVAWSSQGMLRLTPTAMRRLFQPTLDHIKQAIGDVLNNPTTRDIKYMFLVGGFAESAILQMEMRKEFEHLLRILIPQDVGLTILKGAVCFGLDPTIVSVRRSRMTYGVGVLNRFVPDKHPRSKMITKDGAQWCTDVFDKFVEVDQSVAVGETVVRSYAPAKAGQKSTIIHIYSSEKPNPQYISDPGVKRCGTLCLDLTDVQYRHSQKPRRREIQARMTFGDTEVKVTALDVATGKCVRAAIDFMNK